MEREIKAHLMTPLFTLYKVKNINEIILDKDTSERMKNMLNLGIRKGIYNALQWVESNPDFEFESIMKEAPVQGSLNFSNEEVFEYLIKYKEYMENDEYGLLTDDRLTNFPWDNE
jgi:hypothetical protein